MATPTYKVRHQTHATVFKPDGTTQGEWTVHLEHADGTQSSVTVPDSQYTPSGVHKLAQAQSDMVMAVSALPASAPATS